MTTTTYSPIFTKSCVPFHKSECTSNKRLIDPCSCVKYYQCVNQAIIDRECAGGTAYDHTAAPVSSTFCRKREDIYREELCRQDSPWTRCKSISNVTDSDLGSIQQRCRPNENIGTNPEESSSNVGVIVGLTLAGIILIILVIVGYVLYRRGYVPSFSIKKKKHTSKHPVQSRTSMNNPQYFGEPDTITGHNDNNIYEQYSTIDDTVHDLQYNDKPPRLPNRPPSAGSNPTGTGDRKISNTSVQTYIEPSLSEKYGFANHGLDMSEDGNQKSNDDDRFYFEIMPDIPSNGHIESAHTHNRTDDEVSPYDNSLHV